MMYFIKNKEKLTAPKSDSSLTLNRIVIKLLAKLKLLRVVLGQRL